MNEPIAFVPRTTAPSLTNPYWIKTTYGGYNRCILINETTGSVLPNCVGYAWGRFLEENGLTDCNLSRGDARNWFGHTSDGYQRGQTPKLGAVICWDNPSSGGHVAIVEKIYDNGKILTSNSAYNGTRFYMKTLSPPNYYMGSAYIFQGFIYPPNDFDPTPSPNVNVKNKFPWFIYARKLRNKSNY